MLGTIGTGFVFGLLFTEVISAPGWCWAACVMLGLAAGGMWQIGAQTIIDDSGFKHFGSKWGVILLFNYLGMFIGGQFLAHFDMT